MKSFPSATRKGGESLNQSTANSSLKDVLTNSFTSAMTSTISGMTSGKKLDTEGINWNAMPDYKEDHNRYDFTTYERQVHITNNMLMPGSTPAYIENVFRIGNEVFDQMNNYRGYYADISVINNSVENLQNAEKNKQAEVMKFNKITPSLFNPFYGLITSSITDNVPLLDNAENMDDYMTYISALISDCSIEQLVKESKEKVGTNGSVTKKIKTAKTQIDKDGNESYVTKDGKIDYEESHKNVGIVAKNNENEKTGVINLLGYAKYKYADFMYCKHLGQVSNNHLITLRKYAFPVGDDITTFNRNQDAVQPDIARLVTWFGTEDNKLEDIMTYDYEATWKELKSDHDYQQSQEQDPERGVMGRIINYVSTADGVKEGIINSDPFLKSMLGSFGGQAAYAGNPVKTGSHFDKNKIYDPINTIRTTHKYEGELKFNQEINLKFSYKLRAYDNINPKSAMLDLLSNILVMSYKNGNFWTGSRLILGAQPNNAAWNKVEAIVNAGQAKMTSFFEQILNGGFNLEGLLGSMSSSLSEAAGKFVEVLQSGKVTDVLKDIGKATISQVAGLIHNKLGRPSIYAFASLLDGSEVGLWHLTVGNPKNPIASFGNLILTKAKVTHTGPLGIDDFPTELQLQVTLKHARPRDAGEIQRMYTKGMRQIYYLLNTWELSNGSNNSDEYFKTSEDYLISSDDLGIDGLKRLKDIRNELI